MKALENYQFQTHAIPVQTIETPKINKHASDKIKWEMTEWRKKVRENIFKLASLYSTKAGILYARLYEFVEMEYGKAITQSQIDRIKAKYKCKQYGNKLDVIEENHRLKNMFEWYLNDLFIQASIKKRISKDEYEMIRDYCNGECALVNLNKHLEYTVYLAFNDTRHCIAIKSVHNDAGNKLNQKRYGAFYTELYNEILSLTPVKS